MGASVSTSMFDLVFRRRRTGGPRPRLEPTRFQRAVLVAVAQLGPHTRNINLHDYFMHITQLYRAAKSRPRGTKAPLPPSPDDEPPMGKLYVALLSLDEDGYITSKRELEPGREYPRLSYTISYAGSMVLERTIRQKKRV